MKIFILLPDLRIGGAEKVSINIANYLIEKNHNISFVLMKNHVDYYDIIDKRIKIIDLDCNKIRKALFPLLKLFSKHKPDIILSSMWPLTTISIFSWILARKIGKIFLIDHVPLFTSRKYETQTSEFLMKISIKFSYFFASGIICVSKGIRDELIQFTQLNKDKFKVIYNPIIKKNKKIINQFNDLWIPIEGHKILTIGSLKEAKDHSTLIKVFSLVLQSIKAQLVIIGDGPLKKKLEKLIIDLNLSNFVKIIDKDTNLDKWYSSADLFVLSSKWEGFGNVLIEAMEHELPIVSTDCPYGPKEILQNGKYGKLVKLNDSDNFSKAIINSLSQKKNENILKKRSLEYSIENKVEEYINYFKLK